MKADVHVVSAGGRIQPAGQIALAVIALVYAMQALYGITWGLPGGHADWFLFGGKEPWSGKKIDQLARGAEKFAATRGSDVDMDPVAQEKVTRQVDLSSDEAALARLYLRYRLYTYQPDEMISMMALAGMRPGQGQFDPKLYQYGGLFIYPVGALIKLCGVLGLIDVRSDLVFYLDNPDEFAKFYIVARAYSAAWGLIGVFLVFAIARRLGGPRAGLLAALLFAMMPVVVCMSHEGKPHLPGAVLMLFAVHCAMRRPGEPWTRRGAAAHTHVGVRWTVSVACGGAVGMVLSSAPILVLIPLTTWISHSCHESSTASRGLPRRAATAARLGWIRNAFIGILAAGVVYLICNPYIAINSFANREVLRSNFGNSLAMYEISRIGEGFMRVIELTAEGSSWSILIFGSIGFVTRLVARGDLAAGNESASGNAASEDVGSRLAGTGTPGLSGPNMTEIDAHLCSASCRSKKTEMLILAVPAAVFFLQFVLIGAGKPGEYGRFGIFTNAAFAIAAACLFASSWAKRNRLASAACIALTVAATTFGGFKYQWGFRADATHKGSRALLAAWIADQSRAAVAEGTTLELAVLREPAPYCLPPIDFTATSVVLYPSVENFLRRPKTQPAVLIEPVDRQVAGNKDSHSPFSTRVAPPWATPISWADKPFLVRAELPPFTESVP